MQVDGHSVGAAVNYKFAAVESNHTISAAFVDPYIPLRQAPSPGGSISPSGSVRVAAGSDKAFTITPNANYRISDVQVDGHSVGAVSSYKFTGLAADRNITATFAHITYTILASAAEGGTISPAGSVTVNKGAGKTFRITPAPGNKIANVRVDGVSVGATVSYTFSRVSANHSIKAVFAGSCQFPIAEAGPDQTVQSGAEVILNGSNSTDPVNGIASYNWVQTLGPAVRLVTPRSAICSFIAPTVATGAALEFRLYVRNKTGVTVSDTCFVNVFRDLSAARGECRSRPDRYPGYRRNFGRFRFQAPPMTGLPAINGHGRAGPVVEISNANTAVASFVAPDMGPRRLHYVFPTPCNRPRRHEDNQQLPGKCRRDKRAARRQCRFRPDSVRW